jgi:hypothetical protein
MGGERIMHNRDGRYYKIRSENLKRRGYSAELGLDEG